MKFQFDKLRLLRQEAGMTQTELANMLNVSQSTYGGYEKGTVAVSIDKLLILCNIYHVDIATFFKDEKEPKTGQISPETTGTVQEEAPTERTSPDAPLCTVSITINVNTDKDKRKVGQILQLLQ